MPNKNPAFAPKLRPGVAVGYAKGARGKPAFAPKLRRGKQKLVIIDSNALIHRAFHALPPLSDKDGRLTNAVYGFTLILMKTIKDLKPDYLAACFDLKAKTFRHEEYEAYKATRTKQPDELYDQIPLVKEVVKAFNIPIFEKEGYEADDLIGTISHLKSVDRPDIDTIIVTGDQDTLQLVDDNTRVLSPRQGMSETVLYDEKAVKEKFGGLSPRQLIDYKGLRGDPSDNIPGVKGIGEKGAIELLNNFGSIESIYQNIESKKIKDRIRELLKTKEADARLSRKLATIILEVPLDFQLADCQFGGFDKGAVVEIFQKFNFKRLLAQLATLETGGLEIQGGARLRPNGLRRGEGRQGGLFPLLSKEGPGEVLKANAKRNDFQARGELKIDNKKDKQNYQLVSDEKSLKRFITELKKQKEFSFDTETTGLDPLRDQLLGISFSWQNHEAYYLPMEMIKAAENDLMKIFGNSAIKKIGHNLKFDIEILNQYFQFPSFPKRGQGEVLRATKKEGASKPLSGLPLERGDKIRGLHFDTMIASYILSPGHRQHNLDTLAFVELGYQMQPIEELIGKGKSQISMAEVPLEKISWYSCEDAEITWQLYKKLAPELADQGMLGLFEKMDMPLVEVLGEMEKNGVKIDAKRLGEMSGQLAKRIKDLESRIYKLAGEKFNVASPLQLKAVLFDKLKISTAGLGKTKTGISTAAGELEKLQGQHQIIDLIMEFRELAKLKNTYLDALPKLINPTDGRVHTSFNQTVTATGRLSSSEPNLQNIPVRTEIGQKIRQAFIAEKGFKILKADYSQIELRIVASLANDQKMLKIFKAGGDIHTQTAAFIHGTKPEAVTREIRRTAKEVNFGVLYGMGAWGLAQRTGISGAQAQEFISRYFATFSGVKKYLDETIALARERGYVETFYGRRRYLPEINSGVQPVKAAAERMAVNMPIQGTAADILKLAMIEIHQKLPPVSPRAKMVLQVHDELVFEVPENEVKKVAALVQKEMNSVYRLRAPIETEVSVGDNWGETQSLKI